MTTAADATIHRIMESEAFRRAHATLAAEHERTVQDIVTLTEIEAPSFQEAKRAEAWRAMAEAHGLQELEIDAEGRPNWEFTPAAAQVPPGTPKSGTGLPFSLGKLTIERGSLLFSDARTGLSIAAEDTTVTAYVGSMSGPYALAGTATVNGTPLKLDLDIGAKAGDGLPASLALSLLADSNAV